MSNESRKSAGFKDRTPVTTARETLLDAVTPHGRTERVSLREADERVVAGKITAERAVPHYRRAAMDGFAVRAEDTFGASQRSPESLRVGEAVTTGTAARVHTGSELPEGADAVVMVEETEVTGDSVTVFDAVAGGENVAPVGEDVEQGQTLYEDGHRLRPSDLGLLKSVGNDTVEVYERATVSVIPTGEELVQDDPEPGEVIETNGQTVTQYVERWGGNATYRDIVTDDVDALRAAITDDLDHDLVVTTGGSSVGERDLLPEVVDGIGEVLVHGVALKPGHPVALGVAQETPILMLPGYPVACIVNAVQFLRPALRRAGHLPSTDPPTTEAELTRKIASEPGTRTYARVELHDEDVDEKTTATPTRASGSGVLSSVALADGWVVVPESVEGYDAGDTVTVEDWEWSQ
ncbi:molybdopterin molybdotransferase MoeA [Haloarcula argentinensis]|uniref:Molybdopterin molybdenumtransferase MoeA n=1 Tax=Haloarcula argentinensis TaxID=43776 RepID=A0A830FVM7_HALAR|nr:gephyrin-like molybdotransferase Glp [Haloarcula argentinensis]EMA18716.1 molybdenum cofactor synthesis protein [Haloarcula argentinensis DSM 12282]MDS0253723.1 molybdopterin molybdotransferase MoeA [Haloarcula argentinensis]GGM47235.1 molybdopterin molybdenumtransferase MoeA [Haloarcula argentinensis]